MNIEDRVKKLEERVTKLEDLLSSKKAISTESSKRDDIEALVLANIDKIGQQDLAVLVLKMKPKRTKAEVKAIFQELGKATGNWFEGSNFTRLLTKGIIREDGVNDKNVTLYSLSKSGDRVTAQKIIEKLRSVK